MERSSESLFIKKYLEYNKNMTTKLFLITLLSIAVLLVIPQVFACSIDGRPYFYVKTPELNNCYFVSYNENLSSDADIVKFINCNNLILSESDQQIFRNVINQFNKQFYVFASINIERQYNSEYLNFQNQIQKVNSDKCDCERYNNITRYDDWTIYVKSSDCEHNTMCQPIPPEGCFNRLTFDLLWSNPFIFLILFFVVIILVIIGIVFLIRFLIKKIKNK